MSRFVMATIVVGTVALLIAAFVPIIINKLTTTEPVQEGGD